MVSSKDIARIVLDGRAPQLTLLCAAGGVPMLIEQLLDLALVGRTEIGVVDTNGHKWIGLFHSDDGVGFGTQGSAGGRRCDGHGHHDLLWMLFPHCADRGAHGGPCSQPVVDQNDGSPGDLGRRMSTSQALFLSLGLRHLVCRDRLQELWRDTSFANNVVVQVATASRSDRADGELGLVGRAELARHDDVQLGVQSRGDLCANGHTAARYGQDQDILIA
jgi:hypothetical protein